MKHLVLFRAGEEWGFTLVELVVVLSLLALAAAISLPSGTSLRRSGETGAAAREMLLFLKMARWTAIVSGTPTRLASFARRDDPATWYVMERLLDTVWIPEAETHRLPEHVRMKTTGAAVKEFTPRGTSVMGSILLEGEGGAVYRISFNPATGRVRLYREGEEVGHDR